MSIQLSNAVSIHPYFKIHSGCEEQFKELIKEFIKSTENEAFCLYYDFSISGDMVFCREAYEDAAGLLEHLSDVSAHIEASGAIAELVRLEIHGPAAELAQLKEPLAELDIQYFEHVAGLVR